MPTLSSLEQLIPAGAVGSQMQDYELEASLGYTAKPCLEKLSRLKAQPVKCLLCNPEDLHLVYRTHKNKRDVGVHVCHLVLGRHMGLTGQTAHLTITPRQKETLLPKISLLIHMLKCYIKKCAGCFKAELPASWSSHL